MALIDRLRLSKDLALEGAAALVMSATDATAIRGIVQLDLAFDIAARTALDHHARTAASNSFPALVSALPELGGHASAISHLHSLRNLEEALSLASTVPADSMALIMRAFVRTKGWAAQILGDATIPNEMWVFDTDLWHDHRWTVACADKREEFVEAMLRVAASTVLKISVPDWVKLNLLGHGRRIEWHEGARAIIHDESAETVTEADVTWAVEVVARSVTALEQEWPRFHLIREAVPQAQDETPSDAAAPASA